MFGLFGALEMGKRSLLAQQFAMTTTGHNISNVNTPGYSRQRVELVSTNPFYTPQGNVGTGVVARSVTHVRDLFLSAQYRIENGNLQRWNATHKALSQLEGFLSEPSDTGLNQLLTDFWNSWENLSTSPESRSSVIEKAKVLVNAFHEYSTQARSLRESIDLDVNNGISRANLLAAQIADLNRQVVASEVAGQKANDLRDKRDFLIDELSALAEVRTIEHESGDVSVLLGSMALVDGAEYLKIQGQTEGSSNSMKTVAYWENTTFRIEFTGGELHANHELRDRLIPEFETQLDQLAAALIEQVNSIHSSGVGANGSTGVNFFTSYLNTAATISLNEEVVNDLNLIAASLSGEPGDVRNAQAISGLRDVTVMMSGSMTINSFYASMVSTLGIRTQEADNLSTNYELLVTQLDNSRESIQGVSTDEEMTQLIKYQRAYEAAARIITYADSALETLISGMGVTR